MDSYRSKDWRKFRAEVIRLDGGVCRSCGRGIEDGVSLHVHHKKYIAGHKPWEYPHSACETLCGGCHAAQHGLIPPKFGWTFAGWDDYGGLDGICECCGKEIRYSFLVSHPDWVTIEVGETCCDNLTSSRAASDLLDSRRRYHSRLKRFVSSKRWSSSRGNHWIKHKGINISIKSDGDLYVIWVDGCKGKVRHETVVAAKEALFAGLESGAVQQYLSKKSNRSLSR